MEGRGSTGPNAGSSYGKDGPSRRHFAGTRGYPYPQHPTRTPFSPLVTGATESQCDAFQSQRERQHQQRQQGKQQHHQHQQQRQQQEILLAGHGEFEPPHAWPGPSLLPQPAVYGANQVRAEQGRYPGGYRIPPRDPRQRTWSQICLGSRGSTAAAASVAAPPAVAPPTKGPWPGMPPSDPRLASSSWSPRHRAPTSHGPSSQAPQRHPVAGAEVTKEFAVPPTEASSHTLHGENGEPPGPPRDGPSKEKLLERLTKTDDGIAQLEPRIEELKKKRRELEASSSADEGNSGLQDAASVQPKLPSIAELIYSQNKEKARLAHSVFDNLGPKVDQPLYRQPSDTAVYHENVKKFEAFRKPLTLHLKKTAQEKEARSKRITDNYNRIKQVWRTEAENKENTAAWKAEDKKQRELFEKQFPELKKKRESRERLLRAGNRVRSDAHMQEIIGGIQEKENADRKMRLNAVVPPTLVDTQELRRPHYCDRSRLVLDPLAEYQELQMQSAWTDQEKDIFREKFVQHAKDFGKIASFLENKSVADCVRHYYLTKKQENYKQLLRKNKAKPQKRKRKATNRRKRKRNSRK